MNREPSTVPSTSVPPTRAQSPSSLEDARSTPSPSESNRGRTDGSRGRSWFLPAVLAVFGLLLAIWAFSSSGDRDQNMERGTEPGAPAQPGAAPPPSNP